jgi:hypothetical protein
MESTIDRTEERAMNLHRLRLGRWLVPFCCFGGSLWGQPAFGLEQGASALESACSYDAATHSVAIQSHGTELSRIGDSIAFNGSPCGEATVSNTDAIHVTRDPAIPDAIAGIGIRDIFVPGLTPEQDGEGEIEIVIDLGLYSLSLVGSPGSDHMTFGADGVAINADGDADVLVNRAPRIALAYGGLGDDTISTRGGDGTGAPLGTRVLFLYGDGGNDRLLDGPNDAALRGFGGSDRLSGGGGDDGLYGGVGDDQLTGGRGKDRLNGGRDTDSCSGGPGKDHLSNQCERPS